ncbi:hypothetical protein GCM10011573_23070 [Enterococcus wangshanyuanii]|uniref:Uncharacterized protein n=1 Tax=Enterococcus wangshanyuanii TaxID=2005703 RepID=A0ABQ1P9A4_9ENTE|nr:hypothetical protein GCM10011573_23070 [Enterococcus wangshanyuanii]
MERKTIQTNCLKYVDNGKIDDEQLSSECTIKQKNKADTQSGIRFVFNRIFLFFFNTK